MAGIQLRVVASLLAAQCASDHDHRVQPSRRDAARQPAVARARRAGGERHPHRTGRDASARPRRGAGTRGGLSRRIDGGRRRRRRHDRRGRQRAAGIVDAAGRDPARLGERAGARAFAAVRAARRGGGAGIRADAAALAGRGARRRGSAAVRADARRRVRRAGGAPSAGRAEARIRPRRLCGADAARTGAATASRRSACASTARRRRPPASSSARDGCMAAGSCWRPTACAARAGILRGAVRSLRASPPRCCTAPRCRSTC